ncbi:YhcH/YjgK/YiaL family protein [Celerinatantimonas diazotrophica]|uniref:Biofilm protein TabA n=1 Tax=Celerinatantimonas diazotrophica TaxID=412034 RepID=A0A4V2PNI8_9GAMM|nr:YhcH/YjgK/YiaL family protein [Celerinatantimonas diazotrophica]TCK47261.1 biofilm protein TabA [Celerinatantimonas diazotrophica]CAG9296033.1 Toxin-antitoxin biofilm protein TabA [Celerinatantimonas diazotrophica]
MLQGQLSEIALIEPITPTLGKILKSLLASLNADAPVGRYEVQGDKLFYTVSQDRTQPFAERRSECHRNYLDIQVVLSGEECYGYSLEPLEKVTEDLFNQCDLAFGQPRSERFVTLHCGEFIVFAPNCPHRPLIAIDDKPAEVKKAVIKVHRSLLSE